MPGSACFPNVLSKRGAEWVRFAQCVTDHVEEYTVPQYGDLPDDPVSGYSDEMIVAHMQRYLNRYFTNMRSGAERQRDLMKVAHYACILFMRHRSDRK